MKRIGNETEGFEKLSLEFQYALKRAMDLLEMFVGRSATDVAKRFSDRFFGMDTESLVRLMKLFSDLSLIKNWHIDGKLLPYETRPLKPEGTQNSTNRQTIEKLKNINSTRSLSRTLKCAVLTTMLFTLLILIDPPVTIIGWLISLGIEAMLIYIVIQILFLTRDSNSH
jgi:hypothetical protein